MAFKNIAEIINTAISNKKRRTVAVAAAESHHVLEAVMMARKDGIVEPLLVGNKKKILSILEEIGESVAEDQIYESSDDAAAASIAVQLVKQGEADFLMKGLLNTADILRAVLNKTDGLPNGGLITQMSYAEIPGYHKLVVYNDAAITPYPTLEQKVKQIKAVTEVMHNMGYGDDIKIAALCASESVSPKILETVEADQLKQMNLAGEITGCIVDGPMQLDAALDAEAAKIKKIVSPVAGDADVLLFPNLVTGNVLAKGLQMFGGARSAGMAIGASVPISITSRAASTQIKYESLVIAASSVK